MHFFGLKFPQLIVFPNEPPPQTSIVQIIHLWLFDNFYFQTSQAKYELFIVRDLLRVLGFCSFRLKRVDGTGH